MSLFLIFFLLGRKLLLFNIRMSQNIDYVFPELIYLSCNFIFKINEIRVDLVVKNNFNQLSGRLTNKYIEVL